MQDKPLISVCMLCYNHESYVAQSIQSVLDQTYQNWEFIITDNASTDNSREIIEEYVLKDKRIKFYPLEYNSYPSGGINNSIKHSSGEYIAVLSADDYFMPNKLERQIEFMLSNNLDISFTWIYVVDSLSNVMENHEVELWFNDNKTESYIDIFKNYTLYRNKTNAVTAIIKNDKLTKVILHDGRLLQTQDFELWLRIGCITNKISILHQKLTNYRVLDNGNNLSINKSQATKNRTDFEMVYVFNEMTNFDNNTLSKVINKNINNDNKLQLLYEHFEDNNITLGQFAVLMKIFEKLGHDCDVKSELFQFFFSKYASLDFRNNKIIKEKEEGISWLEGQVENYKLALSQKEDGVKWLEGQVENYKLALSQKEDGIKWLEGQVENYKLALSQKEDGIKWLEGQVENYKLALSQKEDGIKSLECQVENYKLDGIKQRLELEMIYSSFSWRFTKLFRFFRKYLNN